MGIRRFRVGELLRLWAAGRSGLAQPHVVTVELAEAHRIWILAPDVPLSVGEEVMVERPVHDDARYQASMRVGSRVKKSFALQLPEHWDRVQDRAFVRVSTDRIPVEGVPPDGGQECIDLAMLDLSAGGMRVETLASLEPGEDLEFRFELPECPVLFHIPARVARVLEDELRSGRILQAGLQFSKLAYPIETELTRWVFNAQVRRPRVPPDEARRQRR